MRTLRGVGGLLVVLVVLVVLAGCNTEQPLQTGTQNASLDFASYTLGNLVDVWDEYRDVNGNQLIDPGEPLVGVHCADTYPPPEGAGHTVLKFPALWGFTAEVKVFHEGQTTATYLIPRSAAADFSNIPEWQDDLTHYPAIPAFPDVPFDFDPTSPLLYNNPRRMINTSSVVMHCTASTLPTTNLAGGPLPFQFTLEPGDTIVVSAGRDPSPLLLSWADSPSNFDALLKVNGAVVIPLGSTTTTAANGTISFSYGFH